MKNIFLIFTTLFLFSLSAGAQNFITKNGKISLFSKTDAENIDAVNNQAVSVINTQTGSVAFSVLVNGFLFKKALMQEHFNENYMESDKFPKATFAGTITNLSDINFGKDGSYKATVKGKMTIHGVTKDVSSTGTIKVSKGAINVTNSFKILLADYGIEIPSVVKDKISKEVEVAVNSDYKAM